MMKDAEAHAEEDRKRREDAETRNNADSLVFQTEKLLKEQADKVSPEDREKMDAAVKQLKDALAGDDIEAVKRGHENLVSVSQEFAQRLYQAAQASSAAAGGAGGPGGGAGAGASQPSDDEVADAEIVDEPGEQTA
jgi:molecular chaperone DnaK